MTGALDFLVQVMELVRQTGGTTALPTWRRGVWGMPYRRASGLHKLFCPPPPIPRAVQAADTVCHVQAAPFGAGYAHDRSWQLEPDFR